MRGCTRVGPLIVDECHIIASQGRGIVLKRPSCGLPKLTRMQKFGCCPLQLQMLTSFPHG